MKGETWQSGVSLLSIMAPSFLPLSVEIKIILLLLGSSGRLCPLTDDNDDDGRWTPTLTACHPPAPDISLSACIRASRCTSTKTSALIGRMQSSQTSTFKSIFFFLLSLESKPFPSILNWSNIRLNPIRASRMCLWCVWMHVLNRGAPDETT